MFFKIFVLSTVVIGLTTGCSSTHRTSHSARTATEQLLISEAIIRSLPREPEGPLPISKDSKVILDISGLTTDQKLLEQVLTGWLGQQGYLVQKEEKNATHRINVIVSALGTELAGTFFGMPPVQSVLIPFSLPELSLYKAQHQVGYVKFYMNLFEVPDGRFVGSTSTFLADTYYSDYTVLFVLSFTSTDLVAPPQTGSFHRNPLNALDIRMEEAKFWTDKQNTEASPVK